MFPDRDPDSYREELIAMGASEDEANEAAEQLRKQQSD